MDNLIEQFVDDLKFDVLIGWCGIFNIPTNVDQWADDEWVDKESELRIQVAAAICQFGKK